MRRAVDPPVYRAAEELLASGQLGEITTVGGGAQSIVSSDHGPVYEVWVGVVRGAFSAECDCADEGVEPNELCVHAVAVTLAALRGGFTWSSAATPPSGAVIEPEVRRLADVAATLPPRRLAMLVAEHAAVDRRLATRLMTYAGKLGPLTDAELAVLRKTIDGIAQDATAGRWDLHDVAKAGQRIVDELEVVAMRPASAQALLLVEHAAQVWDGLSGYLYEGWETYGAEPEEIGGGLRAVHVRMCEELQPDPDQLVGRLIEILAQSDVTSCLDDPEDYMSLLGRERITTLRRRRCPPGSPSWSGKGLPARPASH